MNTIKYSGFIYQGSFKLPYQYDEDELDETLVRLAETQHHQMLRKDYNTIDQHGYLHVWTTNFFTIQTQHITLDLGDTYQDSWLFLNGEQIEIQNIFLYSGFHRLVIIKYDQKSYDYLGEINLSILSANQESFEIEYTEELSRIFSIHDLSELEEFIEGAISPDSEYAAVIIKQCDTDLDKYKYQLKLFKLNHETKEMEVIFGAQYQDPHTIRFSPDSNYIALVCTSADGDWDEIRSICIQSRYEKIIVSGLHNANYLCWDTDSKGLFFVCDDDQTPEKVDALHFSSIAERRPWWRKQKVLGYVTCTENTEEFLYRLTPRMYEINNLHVDNVNKELFYIEEKEATSGGPKVNLHKLNLHNFTKEIIHLPNAFIVNLSLSPCNRYLAYIGAKVEDINNEPIRLTDYYAMKDDNCIGYNINIYDTRVFILDMEEKTIRQLGNDKSIQASIPIGTARLNQEIHWHNSQDFYYIGTRGSQTVLIHDSILPQFEPRIYSLGDGVSKNHSFANNGKCFCFQSHSGKPFSPGVFIPNEAFSLYKNHSIDKLPAAFNWHDFQYVQEIKANEAWLYMPSHLSDHKKIPLVVYLYGGASPLTTSFDELHQCLVTSGIGVLVINPSGCGGYGTDNADIHVNDWGMKTVNEVIHTIEQSIEKHPVLDRENIGIYGGSYGGFLTTLLISKSNLFKAACSIAGITNITNYWGSSYFGYIYGLSALSNSYPWNNKEIFVNQSPIFSSDKIHTPLLMLHGRKDTNVPISESEQLFTALKLQNKEVSFILFPEEQHSIKSKPSSFIYQKKYIIAWFEKYLKQNPLLWEQLVQRDIEQTF
ncbi:alpha/beta hydrolase family protein [Bacillus thuringiensis]|uniref:alpha/beta hydrolase family protein n=1 Tax=Bacillus thuringiensis TaxID=1428 RepID=UPI000CD91926|nr:prolyl oligopeptidase family serine peptidase [Bacillus thuringiensis]QFQ28453.1 S9 family peptidase [Bacillus thuringiensis]